MSVRVKAGVVGKPRGKRRARTPAATFGAYKITSYAIDDLFLWSFLSIHLGWVTTFGNRGFGRLRPEFAPAGFVDRLRIPRTVMHRWKREFRTAIAIAGDAFLSGQTKRCVELLLPFASFGQIMEWTRDYDRVAFGNRIVLTYNADSNPFEAIQEAIEKTLHRPPQEPRPVLVSQQIYDELETRFRGTGAAYNRNRLTLAMLRDERRAHEIARRETERAYSDAIRGHRGITVIDTIDEAQITRVAEMLGGKYAPGSTKQSFAARGRAKAERRGAASHPRAKRAR